MRMSTRLIPRRHISIEAKLFFFLMALWACGAYLMLTPHTSAWWVF